MAKKYRLGLDVGTASVGAAAVELNDRNEPVNLAWHLVRIFDEPLEKGQGGLASKKAGRRQARMQRRQIDRRSSRLRRIAHLSALLGLKREEIPPDDGNHLPHLRADAAVKRVELADLLRIFLRLSKRRGYKGEFKAKQKGEVAQGSGELENAMKTLAEERGAAEITLGQYLLHRLENGLPSKLKIKEHSEEPKGKKGEVKTDSANAPTNFYAYAEWSSANSTSSGTRNPAFTTSSTVRTMAAPSANYSAKHCSFSVRSNRLPIWWLNAGLNLPCRAHRAHKWRSNDSVSKKRWRICAGVWEKEPNRWCRNKRL